MLTQIINGKIFTPQGWLDEGSVLIRDNKILEVTNCDLALIGAKLIDAKGMYIVPGYVCIHAHGGILLNAQIYAGIIKPEEAFGALTPYGGIVKIELS